MTVAEGWHILAWGQPPVWEEVSRPAPREGEVLIAVEACGVGLTVVNCINGDIADDPALLPRVPGHELVGRVVDAGLGEGRMLVGRRVAAYTYLSCGICPECTAGRDSRCRRLAGWVGVHRDGGYAPWTVLPTHNAVPIPEALDPVAATVLCDALATSMHVCGSRARLTPADRVAVLGAGGGVGAHLVQVARLFGARVAGLDVDDHKLAALEDLGVAAVRSSPALDPVLWPAGPPTCVIDLVGSAETLAWSHAALAVGGRLIVLTTFRDRTAPLDPRAMVFGETSVIASRYANRAELLAAADLLAADRVRAVVGEVVDPPDVLELHDALRAGTLVGRGAVRWS